MSGLYKTDYGAWIQKQVMLIEKQQWDLVDSGHLVEELESLGKQQRQELRNRLSVLMGHLLKWEFQPKKRSRSWLATIRIQRREIAKLLEENPSLKAYLDEALSWSYENGRDLAMGETDLPEDAFPAKLTYSSEQVLDPSFFPGIQSDWTDGARS